MKGIENMKVITVVTKADDFTVKGQVMTFRDVIKIVEKNSAIELIGNNKYLAVLNKDSNRIIDIQF